MAVSGHEVATIQEEAADLAAKNAISVAVSCETIFKIRNGGR